MKREELKLNQQVYDRWWWEEIGTVKQILKTCIKVAFPSGVRTYDNAHIQFLERKKRKMSKIELSLHNKDKEKIAKKTAEKIFKLLDKEMKNDGWLKAVTLQHCLDVVQSERE